MLSSEWQKSRRSSQGNCVEVRRLPAGDVQIRDSKDPSGPVLRCTEKNWEAFLQGVMEGEFSID